MKKMKLACASVLALALLTGCSDATAKLKDSGTTLLSVGKKNVTKGQMYNAMLNYSGASLIINNAKSAIAEKEIEITEEMKESAKSTLEMYTSFYGEYFSTYLASNGMTEDDYMNEYLIPSQQTEKLVNKYIEENFADVVAHYQPIQATVIAFSSEEEANTAKEAIEAGMDPSEAASSNNSVSGGTPSIYTTESTDLDATVRTAVFGASEEDGWTVIAASDGATYSLFKIDSKNPEDFKDACIESLSSVSGVDEASDVYWFKKYDFHIYDKTVYDMIAADYPEYLIQDTVSK